MTDHTPAELHEAVEQFRAQTADREEMADGTVALKGN